MTPKTPEECANMTEIRAEIDALDKEVIALLGRRFRFVEAAAKFKRTEQEVAAPERFRAMLAQRRLWAEEQGLSPDATETMYQNLVTHFIAEEKKRWRAHNEERED